MIQYCKKSYNVSHLCDTCLRYTNTLNAFFILYVASLFEIWFTVLDAGLMCPRPMCPRPKILGCCAP
jgi:hypothetical protein